MSLSLGWFLKYIKQYPEEPKFYASYGSFMHKLLEMYYKGLLSKENLLIKFLFDFHREVQGERPQESTVQKYIEAGKTYFKNFKPFPYNQLGVEKKVEFKIGDSNFVGYIDYLGEKDGELYIIDNKSRDLKPRSKRSKPTVKDQELDDMLVQLYIYAKAVKQEYGKFPKSLCFNCFKSNTFIEEPFVEHKYNEAIEWARTNIDILKDSDDFPPYVDYFGCKWLCPYTEICEYQGMG